MRLGDETWRLKAKGTCIDINVNLAISPINSARRFSTMHSRSSGGALGPKRKMRGS